MVTWEPWDYLGDINQPAYSLSSIIGGAHDSYITRFALDAKAWGHPFFLRFAHEMNGDWYPWNEGINGNTPGQYVQAWRHVHDLFTANGVTNVTWVWSPNIEYTGSIPLSGLYPGDAYTDWIAMDGYNWAAACRRDRLYGVDRRQGQLDHERAFNGDLQLPAHQGLYLVQRRQRNRLAH
jgi:beta-mannanase